VKVDSCDATDSGTKVTKLCNHYKLVVIHLKKGLLDILETCTQQIWKYWDQEAEGRSLSPRKCTGPDLEVQVLVFIGADCDQVSGKSEGGSVAMVSDISYPLYPLKVIQKTYQNKHPHINIPRIGFIIIDDRFVGYVFEEGEALALEEAAAKYEKMERKGGPFSFGIGAVAKYEKKEHEAVATYEKKERNRGPFSFGIELLWEQHREQIPGDGFPKTLSVVMNSCGFQIVNFIIGVPINPTLLSGFQID